MSLSSLSSSQLQQLIKLVKEKEAIQVKLAQVERALDALEDGNETKKLSPQKAGTRRRRRTALKSALLMALQSVGGHGLTVKELADCINAKPASVSVWFYTTGKKVKGIKKVAPGRYAYLP